MCIERIVALSDPVEGASGSMLGTPGPVNWNRWTINPIRRSDTDPAENSVFT